MIVKVIKSIWSAYSVLFKETKPVYELIGFDPTDCSCTLKPASVPAPFQMKGFDVPMRLDIFYNMRAADAAFLGFYLGVSSDHKNLFLAKFKKNMAGYDFRPAEPTEHEYFIRGMDEIEKKLIIFQPKSKKEFMLPATMILTNRNLISRFAPQSSFYIGYRAAEEVQGFTEV